MLAFFVPSKSIVLFGALALFIGLVLGGSQALSRSLYSQLVPKGKEAEYFSFYQAMERGRSWGTGRPVPIDRRTALACAAVRAGLAPEA